MRLAGCVAMELVVAASLLGGTAVGTARGLAFAQAFWTTRSGAGVPGRVPGRLALAPRQDLSTEFKTMVATEASGTFLGMSDDLLLARLGSQPVTRLKLNRGGSSLSFRVDFADGSRAAWKPAQTNGQTVPRKEIAAYRLNRLLGLSAVPPAIARAISRDDLFERLHPESLPALPRIRAETIVGPSGMVAGEASYWIPVIRDSSFDTPTGRQQMADWLTQGQPIPYAARSMVAQEAMLVVFDFLIANPDRHSGGNMKTSADGSRLFFMDNTMAFFLDPEGPDKNRGWLQKTQRFSRALHEALDRVDAATLRPLMLDPDGTEILTDAEIRAVVARRQYVQRYVAGLIKQFGERKVLCFP